MSKVITTDEGLTVHWHNKQYAVVKTYAYLTNNMYQVYEKIDDRTWERRPKNGIDLFKTIKAAKEHIRTLPTPIKETKEDK